MGPSWPAKTFSWSPKPSPGQLSPSPGHLRPSPRHLRPSPGHLRPCPGHPRPPPGHLRPLLSYLRPSPNYPRLPSSGRRTSCHPIPQAITGVWAPSLPSPSPVSLYVLPGIPPLHVPALILSRSDSPWHDTLDGAPLPLALVLLSAEEDWGSAHHPIPTKAAIRQGHLCHHW